MTKKVETVLNLKENILRSLLDELAAIKATPINKHKSVFKTALNVLSEYPEKVFFGNNGITFPNELQADFSFRVAKELLQLAANGDMKSIPAASIIETYVSNALEKIQSVVNR